MAASTGSGGTAAAAAATGEPAHAVSLLRGLSALRAERSLLDVTVVAGGREFGAHRAVLAAASGYFRAMFGGALREARAERVRLHGVEPECLARLLDFAYTGRVGGLGPDIAERLLRAADLLQFPAVKEACGAWLARQLEPANALDMQDFAEAFACPALAAAAHRFVLRHVSELGAQLERLPLPRLLSYLRDDGLCIPKEEAAFQLALRWVRADPAARAPLLPQLLAHVRLPFVRRFYLLAHVEGEPLVARCPPCLRLLREARDFQAARLDRHDRGPCARMRPRPSTGLAEILVLVGGCDRDCDELVTVDCYNPRTGHWRYLAEFPEHLGGGYSVAALGNDIYVTGKSPARHAAHRGWAVGRQGHPEGTPAPAAGWVLLAGGARAEAFQVLPRALRGPFQGMSKHRSPEPAPRAAPASCAAFIPLSGTRLLLEVEKQQGSLPDAERGPGREAHVVRSSLLVSVSAFALGR